jgi:hypothetical protein
MLTPRAIGVASLSRSSLRSALSWPRSFTASCLPRGHVGGVMVKRFAERPQIGRRVRGEVTRINGDGPAVLLEEASSREPDVPAPQGVREHRVTRSAASPQIPRYFATISFRWAQPSTCEPVGTRRAPRRPA